MIIAVIEYPSDSGHQPAVIVADDIAGATRAAVDLITDYLPTPTPSPAPEGEPGGTRVDQDQAEDGWINGIDGNWLRENPVPDLDDEVAVAAWLDALNNQTTDFCCILYGSSSAPQTGRISDTYTDVRAPGTESPAAGTFSPSRTPARTPTPSPTPSPRPGVRDA